MIRSFVMLINMMENEHKTFNNISIFLRSWLLILVYLTMSQERHQNNNVTFFFVSVIVFDMMELLAKVEAGETMIKS